MKTVRTSLQSGLIMVVNLKTEFKELCEEKGINHNFSAPRTPQQNGVVERKNRVLTEMTRSKLRNIDHMNSTREENLISLILEFLALNVLFTIMIK